MITANGTDTHRDLCFFRHQQRVPITSGERLSEQMHPEVCSDVMTLLTPVHDEPVAKVARRGTLLGGVQDDTEKFGPLKLVLGGIPALYANHEVRLKPCAQYSPSRTDSQEIVTVSNRVKNLLSRVVALEERFNSRPSDVTDQRHRDGLIRYVTAHPFRSVLISPQKT